MADSWNKFGSTKLKADDVKENPEGYIVVRIQTFKGNNVILPELVMERAGKTKNYIVKESELQLLEQIGFNGPSDMVGKSLKFCTYEYFNQAQQRAMEAVKLDLTVPENTKEPKEVDTDEAGINEDSTM